jgi:hypothetical protein
MLAAVCFEGRGKEGWGVGHRPLMILQKTQDAEDAILLAIEAAWYEFEGCFQRGVRSGVS